MQSTALNDLRTSDEKIHRETLTSLLIVLQDTGKVLMRVHTDTDRTVVPTVDILIRLLPIGHYLLANRVKYMK